MDVLPPIQGDNLWSVHKLTDLFGQSGGSFLDEDRELRGVDDAHAELLRLGELRTGSGARGDEVGLLRHAGGRLAAGCDDRLLRTLPGEALQRSGGDDRQPGEHAARVGLRAGAGVAG